MPPNNMIEKMTQNPDKPVELPNIIGPSTFPSNCCKITTITTKYRALIGSINKIRNALGIAPINGPKNGITLVTPIIIAIKQLQFPVESSL